MNLIHGWWVPTRDTWFSVDRIEAWRSVARAILQHVPYQAGARHTAVCAGANVGIYARCFQEVFDTVIAIEPEHENFECLIKNCNGRQGIKAVEAALSDKPGTVPFYKAPHACGAGHIATGRNVQNVDAIMLDQIGLMACDLLQLNVNGHELKALNGAADTIYKHRPVIAIAINHNGEHYGHTPAKVATRMDDMGYYLRGRIDPDVFVFTHKESIA